MKLSGIVLSLLMLAGCSITRVQKDPGIPALEAGYPTAEFQACGRTWHGLGTCRLNPEEPLSKVGLRVQGYFRGTIRVHSSSAEGGCNFDKTVACSGNEAVAFEIPGVADRGCTVGIVVNPEYPEAAEQGVQGRSLSGFLRIRGLESGRSWFGGASRFAEGHPEPLVIPVEGDGSPRISIRGCGLKYDGVVPATGGSARLNLLSTGIRLSDKKICVLEGLVQGEKRRYFSHLLAIHDREFVPLATPRVDIDGESVDIVADPLVSYLILDQETKIRSRASFDFDPSRDHLLRALTVGGRSVIMIYSAADRQWRAR